MHRTAQQFVHSEYSGMQRTSLYSTLYTYKGIKDRSCLNAQVWEHGVNRISRSCCTKSIDDQNRWIRSSSCHVVYVANSPPGGRWRLRTRPHESKIRAYGLLVLTWLLGTPSCEWNDGRIMIFTKNVARAFELESTDSASCCIRFSIAVKPAEMKGCLVDYESMPKVHWPSASLKAPVASFRFENKNA